MKFLKTIAYIVLIFGFSSAAFAHNSKYAVAAGGEQFFWIVNDDSANIFRCTENACRRIGLAFGNKGPFQISADASGQAWIVSTNGIVTHCRAAFENLASCRRIGYAN